ncbi:hypothetical protein [Methylobacterium sp. J-076]|uniref:hypothetical protein n=1 Tax=Methylobacterium sp. J-076 TaxID=2836655 RepID=UPI001FBAA3B7|nr:hypothetical protein [Methylobacterium sp. J-076]MCJ2011944.1 hypothetical protein [Methylobacterium sp. J-076]
MRKAKGRYSAGDWRQPEEADAPEDRRSRGPMIKRWIGAARRRAARAQPEEAGEGAQIITLTWDQTFGRPSTPPDGFGVGPTILFLPRR